MGIFMSDEMNQFLKQQKDGNSSNVKMYYDKKLKKFVPEPKIIDPDRLTPYTKEDSQHW